LRSAAKPLALASRQAAVFGQPQKFLAQNVGRSQFDGGGNRGPVDFDALLERLRSCKLRPHQFDRLREQIGRRWRRLDRYDCVHGLYFKTEPRLRSRQRHLQTAAQASASGEIPAAFNLPMRTK